MLKLSSIEARANIEPSTGPIHGVQPNPNAAPKSSGKAKLLLWLVVKILKSLFINLKLIIPINCNEKNIIIIPAAILKIRELFKKNFPSKEAAEPKVINTREKPNVKKIVLINTKLFFFSLNYLIDVPEIYEI